MPSGTSQPTREPVGPSAPEREPAQGLRILVADPDLGGALSGAALEDAREHAVLPAVHLDPGELDVESLCRAENTREPLYGFLLVSGSVTAKLHMSGRTSLRLIGPGDLVLLADHQREAIPARLEWSVLAPARLAVLDARLHTIAERWPPLLSAIIRRAAEQTSNAFLQQAISQLPRVEERLLALFWSIADRQGVVRPDGIWLEFPATHHMLADMVGAQRPTVSLGLARLAEAGFVRSQADGWLLAPDSRNALVASGGAGDDR